MSIEIEGNLQPNRVSVRFQKCIREKITLTLIALTGILRARAFVIVTQRVVDPVPDIRTAGSMLQIFRDKLRRAAWILAYKAVIMKRDSGPSRVNRA